MILISNLSKYILYYQFSHMVLRRIFGPKRDEVMGEWRKLHNEELLFALFAKHN
jgi:hypothetical protein